MITLNDGGPAFPSTITDDSLHVGGMSLRDYFAAKAMQGLLSMDLKPDVENEELAEAAYAIADAMIKERTRTP